jgi:hypothetical protein
VPQVAKAGEVTGPGLVGWGLTGPGGDAG